MKSSMPFSQFEVRKAVIRKNHILEFQQAGMGRLVKEARS